MSVIITEPSPDATNYYVTIFPQLNAAGKIFERQPDNTIKKESSILSFATGQVHYVPDVDAFSHIL